MRYSLINPAWDFAGSIYFGCREPHLPLEYGYSKLLLEREGHEVEIVDGQLENLTTAQIVERVARFQPDFSVVTTAPSYLFWRCAPPELRVPRNLISALRPAGGKVVVVGPHASTTPRATLVKTVADVAVIGECEEILPRLAGATYGELPVAWRDGDDIRVHGSPHQSNMAELPALRWNKEMLARHAHHHHRFEATPKGPGAEMETSRGCPYHCTFCAKDNFRNTFRRRPLRTIEAELDGLVADGVEYIYFIDEIFLPFKDLLQAISERGIRFGIQTRIDLWNSEMIDLLGAAGCVSIEAGVESITAEGRDLLDKKCKITTAEMTDRLIQARKGVAFVQANLLDSNADNPDEVEAWRQLLQENGVWANKPVPLFPYPGSPDYRNRWGAPDDKAWERAHAFYLGQFDEFSDIQEQRPAPLIQLELTGEQRG